MMLNFSEVEVVKILEATAMERLACIEKRSQELKELLRLRATEHSTQEQTSIDSNENRLDQGCHIQPLAASMSFY